MAFMVRICSLRATIIGKVIVKMPESLLSKFVSTESHELNGNWPNLFDVFLALIMRAATEGEILVKVSQELEHCFEMLVQRVRNMHAIPDPIGQNNDGLLLWTPPGNHCSRIIVDDPGELWNDHRLHRHFVIG